VLTEIETTENTTQYDNYNNRVTLLPSVQWVCSVARTVSEMETEYLRVISAVNPTQIDKNSGFLFLILITEFKVEILP
jgi:hypothetical protein